MCVEMYVSMLPSMNTYTYVCTYCKQSSLIQWNMDKIWGVNVSILCMLLKDLNVCMYIYREGWSRTHVHCIFKEYL